MRISAVDPAQDLLGSAFKVPSLPDQPVNQHRSKRLFGERLLGIDPDEPF